MSVKTNRDFFKKYTDTDAFNRMVNLSTVVELMNHIKQFKNQPAVGLFNETIVPFSVLYNDVKKISNYFISHNIKNKNIGLYCDNGYDFEIISLGIMCSGNTVCLLSKALNKDMVAYYYKTLDLVNLVSDVDLELNNLIKTKDLINSKSTCDDFVNDIKPNDSAAILLTSGTTGKPKGVVLSHDNLMAGTINGCYGMKNPFDRIYYCILPLTHSFGFIRNMLTALYTGSLIYYSKDKSQIINDLIKYKPDILVVVPALAEMFLSLIKKFGFEVCGNRLETIICGSANVPPYLAKEYAKYDVIFGPGYGLTECSNIVTGNPEAIEYPDSVGYILPDQEAKIVNGELYLKGRTLFKGYYKNENETNKIMEDGWLKTGDLAKFGKNNHLYIIGRTKDLIVLPNGENVSPAYIESKIITCDLVKDCLVFDAKNKYGNVVLNVELTLREEVQRKLNLSKDQAFDYIKKHIDKINNELLDFERIYNIIIRDKDFDRSLSMKIIRKKHCYE